MALANVAFLAAQNNLRVLVMDWDLEAPGLAYYFRCLLDTPDVKRLKDSCGILDILWEWRNGINANKSEAELQILLEHFQSGHPFQSCVQSLMDVPGVVLDFIGAGSKNIQTPELRTYEEALSHFSWSKFFEEEAGGHVIDTLRKWAKYHYDIILIDSRTGLADAAGICTMQIPDAVALCFVLNRQNIDGIAKIAAVVKVNRADAVELRAVPMRVARHDTSEESDARARAISSLKRIGGFTAEAVLKDFRELTVAAADNVPFYETLAPFTASNLNYDPLTNNYLQLAAELLSKPLEMPLLDLEWVERIRQRLQPRHATVEYVAKLQSADPSRAISELQRLLDSAFDAEIDGDELDDDYVAALVNAVLAISMSDLAESLVDAEDIQNRTLDLLRILVVENPNQWRALMVSAIERYLMMFFIETEEELALYEELDGLLAQSYSADSRLKRIFHRRTVARMLLDMHDTEATMQTVGEIRTLLIELNRDLSASDQMPEVIAAEVDISLLTGDVFQLKKNIEQAIKEYQKGLNQLPFMELGSSKNELSHLRFELHSRLAVAPLEFVKKIDAAMHAIQAVKCDVGYLAVVKFVPLAQAVLNISEQPNLVIEFCEVALKAVDGRNQNQFAIHLGRQPKSTLEFLSTAVELVKVIGKNDSEGAKSAISLIIDTLTQILHNLSRRRQIIGEKDRETLQIKIHDIISMLKSNGASLAKLSTLEEIINVLGTRRLRGNSPTTLYP